MRVSALERTRNSAQSKDDARAAKTLPDRPSESRQGDDRRARRPASVRDETGPPLGPPRQAATSPPTAWPSCKTPQGFRARHRLEQASSKKTPPTPQPCRTAPGEATQGEDLWVRVGRPGRRTRDRRPDEALPGRLAYSQGCKEQSPRSALDEPPIAQSRRGSPTRETASSPR